MTAPTARADAVREAGECLARARHVRDSLPPAEAARRAWYPGAPDVDTLAQRIAAQREAAAA